MTESTTVDKTAVSLLETSPQSPIETSTATSHDDDSGQGIIKKLLESQPGRNDGTANRVGLVFIHLTIAAPYSDSVIVKTLPLAIWNTFGTDQFRFLKNLFGANSKSKTINILSDFTGLVKPGEMLFVLGRPGSGCSTFLRAAANQSSLAVSGNLSFAGIPHTEFKKRHKRETIYLPEEDRHIASLSVSQTLRFALTMNLPSNFRDNATVDKLVITLGRMFGLEHALETPVGGPYSPGVSGGEKKRVSIAEVLAAGSSVQCFDNSTRGLDSSTALDFIKALRTLTDVGRNTTLATLYQAGQSIYNHFDKVTLLSEGHQVFFGRADEAEAHFKGLGYVKIPGQTTAEFLTTVTDATQRRFTPGTAAEQINTAADLAAAFRSSTIYSRLLEEISDYQKAQTTESSLLSTSSYNLAFLTQIWECLKREYQLVRAQRMVYYIKWITTVILSFVIGSEYFDLTNNASGAFSRSGILFYALIFNGWLQFPELFDAHTNRPVLERQGMC
jgi:ATP-binding cassette subfamily G (WHITE) protein 2 (SNQ2)